jgi:predicted secreted protein
MAEHRVRELPAWRAAAFVLPTIVAAGLWLPTAIVPAAASDMALAEFIGFSDDARYFAFEEYGIADGSGSAYSSIYVIDLAEDRWAAGSPFHNEGIEDSQTLAETRAKARDAARPKLAELAIDKPPQIAALSGDGTIGEASTMHFGFPMYNAPGATSGDFLLTLETYDLPATADCNEDAGTGRSGFALTLKDGGATRELHRDIRLPQSRGCPEGYRLYAVVFPYGDGEIGHAVAIVASYPRGWEGPDRRFLAVPLAAGR